MAAKETKELTIGVAASDSPLTSVLYEIMDHQGLVYEDISMNNKSSTLYPVVILPEYSESSFASAKKNCVSEENVIDSSKLVDLEKIRHYLAGESSIKDDQFDLFVNNEETKLFSQIRDRLARSNLPLVRKVFWPSRAKACCVITHDIDWFTYSPFHKAVFSGEIAQIRLLKLLVTNLLRKRNYGWNIPEMIGLEVNHGCKSTFLSSP